MAWLEKRQIGLAQPKRYWQNSKCFGRDDKKEGFDVTLGGIANAEVPSESDNNNSEQTALEKD